MHIQKSFFYSYKEPSFFLLQRFDSHHYLIKAIANQIIAWDHSCMHACIVPHYCGTQIASTGGGTVHNCVSETTWSTHVMSTGAKLIVLEIQ